MWFWSCHSEATVVFAVSTSTVDVKDDLIRNLELELVTPKHLNRTGPRRACENDPARKSSYCKPLELPARDPAIYIAGRSDSNHAGWLNLSSPPDNLLPIELEPGGVDR